MGPSRLCSAATRHGQSISRVTVFSHHSAGAEASLDRKMTRATGSQPLFDSKSSQFNRRKRHLMKNSCVRVVVAQFSAPISLALQSRFV
jgi:hypothetical protein